ncbi:MAG: hypothetical protein ACI8WB_005906 [Phenylobacterium sp.]|jgi:hypothetical protein
MDYSHTNNTNTRTDRSNLAIIQNPDEQLLQAQLREKHLHAYLRGVKVYNNSLLAQKNGPCHRPWLFSDYTESDTVYKKTLKTVTLKVPGNSYIGSRDEKSVVSKPEQIFDVIKGLFYQLDDYQSHSIMLVLNGLGNLMGYKVIGSGGTNTVVRDCKIIFRNALFLGADSIIITHNHPAGDAHPTIMDAKTTQKIAEAGRAVDIPLLDHVIYTHYEYFSMRRAMPHLFEGD